MIDDFAKRFPTIWAACRTVGLDPTRDWLPVAPAAHYLSGGVVTDLDGATTLPHLWACGETACSGVHGANRLASNSLLDGLVFGRRVVRGDRRGQGRTRVDRRDDGCARRSRRSTAPAPDPVVLRSSAASAPDALRSAVQRTMSADCGVVRDATACAWPARRSPISRGWPTTCRPGRSRRYEVINLVRVARAIVAAALAREESRGAHTRGDFPGRRRPLARPVRDAGRRRARASSRSPHWRAGRDRR